MKAPVGGLRYVQDFLCAGTSALLISVAHLSEGLWFISLFALVPFLWRVTRTSFCESIFVGVLFAFSWNLAAAPSAVLASPASLLAHLLTLSCLFAVYGATVNRLSGYVGLNAVLLAVLWLPVEHALSFHDRFDSMFAFSETDSAFLVRISSLFGVLMVSFIVLAVNLLLLNLLHRIVRTRLRQTAFAKREPDQSYDLFEIIIVDPRLCLFPDLRAPPSFAGLGAFAL